MLHYFIESWLDENDVPLDLYPIYLNKTEQTLLSEKLGDS